MSNDKSHFPRQTDLAFTRVSPYGTLAEPTYSGALSFLRRKYTKDLHGVDVAIIGIPFDLATTNRPGTRFGPRALRQASASLSWCRPDGWDFDPLDRLHVIDYGDLYFDAGQPQQVPDVIRERIASVFDAGAIPITLGGDHFVSFPILQALAAKKGAPALVHFDAHSDSWDDDSGRIDHGTMFFHAARQGIVDVAHSIQIGMRTHNPDTHGFQVLPANWIHAHGIEATLAAIRNRVGNRPCYISFDIDFLDPAFAPGTGTPVVGGLSTHQALHLIRGLTGLQVIGADVVEVCPPYDVGEITALAGASIAHQLLAVIASRYPDRLPATTPA